MALGEMATAAHQAHPSAPLELTLLAITDPKDLQTGVLDNVVREGEFSELYLQRADRQYRSELNLFNEHGINPYLSDAAQDLIDAEDIYNKALPLAELARNTKSLRLRLARRARVGLALSTAVIAVCGSTPIGYKIVNPAHKYSKAEVVQRNKEDDYVEETLVIAGTIGAITGSGIYSVSKGKIATLAAHRKAKKIIARLGA
jgi:hypothetical protein